MFVKTTAYCIAGKFSEFQIAACDSSDPLTRYTKCYIGEYIQTAKFVKAKFKPSQKFHAYGIPFTDK